MDEPTAGIRTDRTPKSVWAGRVLAGLLSLLFVGSAYGKVSAIGPAVEANERLGIPPSLPPVLAVIEVAAAIALVVPRTAIIGAILLTGYMGGAILAHVRVGEPFNPPLVIGVLVWVTVYLRKPPFRELILCGRGTNSAPISDEQARHYRLVVAWTPREEGRLPSIRRTLTKGMFYRCVSSGDSVGIRATNRRTVSSRSRRVNRGQTFR